MRSTEEPAAGSAASGWARGGRGTSKTPAIGAEELRRRYAAYRRRQAAYLVHLMPREAIRPMVRRARARALEESRCSDDPLEMLVDFCETLLPLPVFEIWRADLDRHPDAHLVDVDGSARAPTAAAPSTVAVRDIVYDGLPWHARLKSFRDGAVWRGFIAFDQPDEGWVHRTTTVFREDDPMKLRERFMEFQNGALEAFLRSALP